MEFTTMRIFDNVSHHEYGQRVVLFSMSLRLQDNFDDVTRTRISALVFAVLSGGTQQKLSNRDVQKQLCCYHLKKNSLMHYYFFLDHPPPVHSNENVAVVEICLWSALLTVEMMRSTCFILRLPILGFFCHSKAPKNVIQK